MARNKSSENGTRYYFIDGVRIGEFITEMTGSHFVELTSEQKKFYLENPTATANEVKNFNPSTSFYHCYIFTNGYDLINYNTIGKLYYCKIIDGDILKRNFIPALRISDNKPGLYDLCGSICPLTGTPFYVNEGTGEFLYQYH